MVLDLEEKDGSTIQSQHGPLGKQIREMDWEEILVWLEQMGARDIIIELQREKQHSGQDIENIIQKSWKVAIEEVIFYNSFSAFLFANPKFIAFQIQTALSADRKLAIRMILNATHRNQAKLAPLERRSPLQALDLLIASLEHMACATPGRYHGADALARKFAGDNGVDIIVRLVRDGDGAVCTRALRALGLLCTALEARAAEPSHADALRRFDLRRLAVKAGAVEALAHAREQALR